MKQNEQIDSELNSRLAILKNVPSRNPGHAAAGRSRFVQEAQEMAEKQKGVTAEGAPRHNSWILAIQTMFMPRRKEHSAMFGTLATILVIVSLALGGAGVTVASAQDAQPVDPLYGIKLWSEDARLALASTPSTGVQLALEFSNRRVEEMKSMLESGSIPPESLELRYQLQVEQAIRLALKLPDEKSVQALEQIRVRLQTQLETLSQIHSKSSDNAEGLLYQTRLMIQERLHWVENAITNPNQVREQFRERDQEQKQQNQEPYQNQKGQGSTDQTGNETSLAPAGNPWTTGTPTPGSSYGPGPGSGEENPWTTGIPTPGSSYGTGPGEGNPWTTGTPTPYSGYGPGSGIGTCTATCDGSGTCRGTAQGTGQASQGETRP